MKRRSPIGHQAQTSSRFSKTGRTNCMPFDPFESEIYATVYASQPRSGRRLRIHLCRPHRAFVQPVTAAEIVSTLQRVPSQFLRGLRCVFLLGGNRKQEKTAESNLFRYGSYWAGMIFLHPLPRRLIDHPMRRLPKPSLLQQYVRCGARIEKTPHGWRCRFSPEAMKNFYLKDVLLHELGHHVDRNHLNPLRSHKTHDRAEKYTEWFAENYGGKLATTV